MIRDEDLSEVDFPDVHYDPKVSYFTKSAKVLYLKGSMLVSYCITVLINFFNRIFRTFKV